MATSIQAICKNTFITFVANDADDSIPAWLSPSRMLLPRSRSAEAVRSRPGHEESQELSQQSLQRLSAVLSIGMSPSFQQPQEEFAEVYESMRAQQEVIKDQRTDQSGSDDLQALHGSLANALTQSASLPPKPCEKNSKDLPWKRGQIFHVGSSNSVSTMASSNASQLSTFSQMSMDSELNPKATTTPEERAAEKDRLRKVAKQWMAAAIEGQPCHWLDPTQKVEPQECTYMLDKSLSSFAVKAEGRTLQSFYILNMQDVSTDCAGTPFANIENTDFVCMTIRGNVSAGSPAVKKKKKKGSPAVQHVGLLFPYARKQNEFYLGMKLLRKMLQVKEKLSQER